MKRSRIKQIGKKGKRNATNKQQITQRLLEISNGYCMHCGNKPDWRGLHRHRIKYGSHGGEYTLDNTELWCAPCHFGADGHRTENVRR